MKAQESINQTNVETRASNPSTPDNEKQDFRLPSGSNINTPSHQGLKDRDSAEKSNELIDNSQTNYGILQNKHHKNQR